ncbi:MAG: hypothetical protein R2827_08870 [Bdellovibrionales bacterium]
MLDKNDSLTSADLNIAYGLMENLQVGLSMPYILNQTIEEVANLGQFLGNGFTEFRSFLKYNFY